MAGGVAIEAPGLKEIARDARRFDARLGKEMSRANKEISTFVAEKSQRGLAPLRDAGGRGAAGIRPRATPSKATIALLGSNPFVRAAAMGAELHWVFGRPIPQSAMQRRVWQPWIGNDWTPEEGLYGISPAISSAIPDVLETYADRLLEALSVVYPERA